MIKLLSIASGKTTAQQEAEAGDIPYSQYIKQKEAEQKENTAENGGEDSAKIITEGGEKYSIKNHSYSKEEIESNIEELAYMSPVYDVPAEKLQKTGKKVSEMFADFFNSLGNNIYTEEFGDIALSKSSVKSEIRHGITAEKIATIEAIPAVLVEGKVIFAKKKLNSDVERIVVSAPITIDNIPYYMGVMLQRDSQNQRLYLHNVAIEKETSQGSQADLLTTGADEQNEHLFITNILQKAISVKKDYMQEGKNNTYSTKEISQADKKKQAERKGKVKSLCDLFGLSLEWDESIKRGKYNPDKRTVFINPNLTLTEMYIEVLKHEFTHDLENRKLYKGFKEFLFGKSINFRDYCETALKNDYGEELKGAEAVKKLTELKYRDYMSSEEMSDKEKATFDTEAAEREIVADFVANRLLGGIGTDGKFEQEAYEALKELSEYHRSGFQRFVDWIKELINKIKGQPTFKDMADELEYLNKQIAKVYDSRVSTNETVLDGEQHSIKDDSIKQQLKNNESKLNSMDVIASYNTKKFFEYNQQVVEWVVELYEKINYKVTRSGFGEIILDEKRIKKGMRYTKDNYARKIAFAIIPDVLKKGIQIGFHKKHKNRPYDTYTFAAPVEINGMRGNMAVVVRQDGKNYYKAHQIVMPDGTQMIIDEKRDTAERAGGVENNSGLSPTDNVSIDIIPDNSNTVKGNSDSTDSHSIAVPFSEEFKADKRKRYAEGLVKKYGGNIDGAEEYLNLKFSFSCIIE